MGSTDPFVGVISSKYGIKPLLYWSVCGNELRVYSTESLGSHACRDANALPVQATFSFWSESEPFAFGTPPGSLSSQYSVNPSSVIGSSPQRVFDHFPRPGSAMTSTGRKKLAVRAVSSVEIGDGRRVLVCLVSEHGVESEIHCLDPNSGETIHVATGLPMMLTSLAILPRRIAASSLSNELESMEAGRMDVNLDGFRGSVDSAEDVDFDDCNEIVAAVGGLGGGIQLVGMQVGLGCNDSPATGEKSHRVMARWPRVPGNVPTEREGVPISALEAFLVSKDGGKSTIMVAAGWRDGHWAVAPCYDDGHGTDDALVGRGGGRKVSTAGDLVVGNTSGIGPPLHFVHQDELDDWSPPYAASRSCTGFRLWVGSAEGLMCFKVETRSNPSPSQPQVVAPLMVEKRVLIAGVRPQFVRTMAIGGGPRLSLLVFASLRESDASPVLVILDASRDEMGGGDVVAPSSECMMPSTCHGGCPPMEIELWTRCCPRSVVGANLHSVWVKPLRVTSFVCGGVRGSVVETGGTVQAVSPPKLSLRMSILISEVSLVEGGDTRLRAWEQTHVGAAHWVRAELERLGVMALSDPSQEDWDADVKERVNLVGRVALEHVVGGGEDRLWGRRRRRLAIRGLVTADGQASSAPKISHRPGVTRSAGVDGREAGEGTTTVAPLSDDAASNGDGSVRPSTLLLAVRLQSALELGRGPSVASALTTMVTASAGGGWKLMRPLPVMEWAIAAALEAWDEALTLVTMRHSPSSLRNKLESLDAVMRRSRQLDRILQASTERCRQYFDAARAVAFSVGRLTGGREFFAARRVALDRQEETAPLRRRLTKATLAARMALRISSAGLWVLQLVEWTPPRSPAGSKTGICSDGGSVHSLQGVPVETGVHSSGSLSMVCKPAPMMKRLAEVAGLEDVYGSGMESPVGGALEGRGFEPASILAKVAMQAGRVFEADCSSAGALFADEGHQEVEDDDCGLDRGLAVVAYSVLSHAVQFGKGEETAPDSGDYAGNMSQEREARYPLGREAEETFERFCNQVCLSSTCQVQARVSWLIDHEELSAAATGLLSPWDEADLSADPCLVKLAVSAFAAADEASNNAKCGDVRKGERRFSSLIRRMSRWVRTEERDGVHVEGNGMDVEGDVLRSPSSRSSTIKSKRRRDPSERHRHVRTRRSSLAIPDVLLEMDTRREPGFTFWEVSPGVPLMPARATESMATALVLLPSAGDVPGSRRQEDTSHRLAGSPYGVASAGRLRRTRMNRLRRGRWQIIWEVPRRIWRWISSRQRPTRPSNG